MKFETVTKKEIESLKNDNLINKILAIMKERDQLKQKMDEMLDNDKTGLRTAMGMVSIEKEVLKRSQAEQSPPIFALIDIDFFKAYNSVLGYDRADEKLIALADAFKELEKNASKYDKIHKLNAIHMAGDEFICIFETKGMEGGKNTKHLATALESVESMFGKVQGTIPSDVPADKVNVAGHKGKLTISAGLTFVVGNFTVAQEHANRALQYAKDNKKAALAYTKYELKSKPLFVDAKIKELKNA